MPSVISIRAQRGTQVGFSKILANKRGTASRPRSKILSYAGCAFICVVEEMKAVSSRNFFRRRGIFFLAPLISRAFISNYQTKGTPKIKIFPIKGPVKPPFLSCVVKLFKDKKVAIDPIKPDEAR